MRHVEADTTQVEQLAALITRKELYA